MRWYAFPSARSVRVEENDAQSNLPWTELCDKMLEEDATDSCGAQLHTSLC